MIRRRGHRDIYSAAKTGDERNVGPSLERDDAKTTMDLISHHRHQ